MIICHVSFSRLLPSIESIKSNRWLRPIDQFLHQEQLWHIHQRNIAKAVFIGIFVAFLPLPMHTLIAAAFAILFDANIIVSIATSWIVNNPISMGFRLFYWHQNIWLTSKTFKI